MMHALRLLQLCLLLVAISLVGIACSDEPAAADPVEGAEAGECSDGADNDGDGDFDCGDDDCAASPYCLCDDGCTELDTYECNGDVVRQCTWGPGGCLRWLDVEDCRLTDVSCLRGGCVGSRCSVSGAGCETNVDCEGPNVTITGQCITLDAGGGDLWVCGYDARLDTDATVDCEADTFVQCQSTTDCTAGADCRSHGPLWCGGTQAFGICTIAETGAPCADDAECTYLADDVCVICGDGVIDAPFEECDGEFLCTANCKKGGHCFSSMGDMGTACASTDDCTDMMCKKLGDCTCEPAPEP